MHVRKSTGEIIFIVLNYILLTLIGLLTVFPFLNILAKSLSSEAAVVSGMVTVYPVDLQFGTYKYVIFESMFASSLKVSIFVTVTGTFLSMLLTAVTAYPLSKQELKGRKLLLIIFVFVMLFNGGMIPNYLLIKNLNLMNKVWSLVLPNLIIIFNMLVIKSYFETIPDSLHEAATIDGASNVKILFLIILPISLPVLATVSLFYAVSYWNNYFAAMLYISKPDLKPLQLYLYELISQSQSIEERVTDMTDLTNLTTEAVRTATIIVSTVPILVVYPFLQRYFVKGMIIGSVKG